MKIIKNKFFITFLLFLTGVSVYCQPPAPGDENPPDLPINENATILLLIALFFGIYAIHRYNKNKKASI